MKLVLRLQVAVPQVVVSEVDAAASAVEVEPSSSSEEERHMEPQLRRPELRQVAKHIKTFFK